MAFSYKKRNLCPKLGVKDNKNGTLKRYPGYIKRFRCRRTPSIILSHGRRGSLTVEASLVLPLFLFFILQLISILQFLSCYGRIEAALHQTARQASVYAYLYGQGENTDKEYSENGREAIEGLAASSLGMSYIKEEVERQIGKEYLEHSPIIGGKDGLSYLHSSIMGEENCIDLSLDYKMRPLLAFPGIMDIKLMNRCRMRAWTGYDVTAESEEPALTVYIADHASVYHKSVECTHLRLSVSEVSGGSVEKLRNAAGGKYYACEICGKHSRTGNRCYITMQGNRYHNSIGCSGLKRSIQEISINEAMERGLRPCGRCGR